MFREKIIWYPDELLFLKQNINSMTNQQLLDEINSKRLTPVSYGSMRLQFIRMGILRQIQIRWSQEDIEYLKRNFRKKGDYELAIRLTKRRKTFRVIDGKKVYRKFNKKNVEKKRELLKLKRTKEELDAILQRNIKIGIKPVFTKDDNYWTRNYEQIAEENEIRIWKRDNSTLYRVIKINGKFTPYTRWFYHNYIAPVPSNKIVFHIDMDSLNDEPDNLEVRTMKRVNKADRLRALPLLKIRLEKQREKLEDTATRRKEHLKCHKEFARLKNLIRNIENKINHANHNPTKQTGYYTGEIS